jgi:hypothetical protein
VGNKPSVLYSERVYNRHDDQMKYTPEKSGYHLKEKSSIFSEVEFYEIKCLNSIQNHYKFLAHYSECGT